MGKIRIGISGWSYREWRGSFYPDDLHHDEELRYAAKAFDSIEINGTFYSLTDPQTCRRWAAAAPRGHKYALKGSRYITHIKRLKEAQQALANFFASGILELGDHLGPVLWQLPPDLGFDSSRVSDFLDLLPHHTRDAVSLARNHDDRVADVSFGDGSSHRIRHALEVRHKSFMCEEMARLASRYGTALCFSHSSEWPYLEELTAGFVYVRLHGPEELYASEYGGTRLEAWARRILTWRDGREPEDAARISELQPPKRKERDVYVYFDNTAFGHAPSDASKLREILQARSAT